MLFLNAETIILNMDKPKLRPVIEIYEESASFWKEERAKSTFSEKKYMNWILERLSPGDEILDIGCGSGFPIADHFLKNGFKVTGIDAVQEMIEFAQMAFPDAAWKVADMRTLNLHQKFGAIVAWDSFFHLNFLEQEQMFPIFKNHLKPAGLLVFTSGPERGEAIGDMNGNPLFHASLSPDEYRKLLNENGFDVESFHPEDKDCGGHTVWLCRQSSL